MSPGVPEKPLSLQEDVLKPSGYQPCGREFPDLCGESPKEKLRGTDLETETL